MRWSVLCLLFIAVITNSADSASVWEPRGNEDLVRIRDDCFKSENLSKESIEKIMKNEYPDDPTVHCYVRCTSVHVGTWSDDAGPNIDRTMLQIQKSGNAITRDELVKCTPMKQDNKCLMAYQGLMCILKSEGVKSEIIK